MHSCNRENNQKYAYTKWDVKLEAVIVIYFQQLSNAHLQLITQMQNASTTN